MIVGKGPFMSDVGGSPVTKPMGSASPWLMWSAIGVVAIPLVALVLSTIDTSATSFEEGGPVEIAGGLFWAFSSGAAIFGIWRAPSGRDRLNAVWLAVLSVVACLRECDMHVILNPKNAGWWGVSYKISWWLSSDAPVLPRVMWGLVAVILGILAVIPPLIVRPPTVLLVRSRDPATLTFIGSCVLLAVGYLMDDQVGRDQFIPSQESVPIEEIAEVCGEFLWAVSLFLTVRQPLSVRIARHAAKKRGSMPSA